MIWLASLMLKYWSFSITLANTTYIHACTAGTRGSIVIVISPLIALMMEQTTKFREMGLNALCCCDEKDVSGVLSGQAQLVFISPESLMCNYKYRNMLLSSAYQQSLVAVVVDEAHCIKMW